jgi:hypothetical protein
MIRQFELVERIKSYDPQADEDLINRGYVFAMKAHGSQTRASGDPYFSHPLEVAGILTGYRLDATIVTALLRRGGATTATLADIERLFGAEVANRWMASQIDADRNAVRPRQAGGKFAIVAGDVGRHPGAVGEAGRPPAQHAHAALHPVDKRKRIATKPWKSSRRLSNASAWEMKNN